MKKEIFVLGDIEIGAGNLTDDFISDKLFAKFVKSISRKDHPVDLILNGDTFDFLKCPYIKDGRITFPRHITYEISSNKLKSMYNAHKLFFKALAYFAKQTSNNIYFIIGNHDHDLFHKRLQKDIKKILRADKNIHFSISYEQHKVYAEHGQEYDFLNKVNMSQLYVMHGNKPILNFPWISFGLMGNMMFIKEKHPFMERITPYPLLFSQHKVILHKILWEGLKYLLLSVFYYPIRYLTDPTYSFPKGLIGEFFQRIKNTHWDVDQIVETFKRRRRKILRRNKVFVFGHVHEKFMEEKGGKVILHPDTWRDEYTLEPKTKKVIPKTKMYVHIEVDEDNELRWSLEDVPHKRKTLNLNSIIQNEKKALLDVAKEEGYPLHILYHD